MIEGLTPEARKAFEKIARDMGVQKPRVRVQVGGRVILPADTNQQPQAGLATKRIRKKLAYSKLRFQGVKNAKSSPSPAEVDQVPKDAESLTAVAQVEHPLPASHTPNHEQSEVERKARISEIDAELERLARRKRIKNLQGEIAKFQSSIDS